jgi:hypothetical protein
MGVGRMSFEDKEHVCSDCYVRSTTKERERILRLIRTYWCGQPFCEKHMVDMEALIEAIQG